jgi:hypothetical protein
LVVESNNPSPTAICLAATAEELECDELEEEELEDDELDDDELDDDELDDDELDDDALDDEELEAELVGLMAKYIKYYGMMINTFNCCSIGERGD